MSLTAAIRATSPASSCWIRPSSSRAQAWPSRSPRRRNKSRACLSSARRLRNLRSAAARRRLRTARRPRRTANRRSEIGQRPLVAGDGRPVVAGQLLYQAQVGQGDGLRERPLMPYRRRITIPRQSGGGLRLPGHAGAGGLSPGLARASPRLLYLAWTRAAPARTPSPRPWPRRSRLPLKDPLMTLVLDLLRFHHHRHSPRTRSGTETGMPGGLGREPKF
jgi:hypothetical protein